MPVVTTRPRIWITPATLPLLKAKAVPTNDRWQNLFTLSSGPPSWDVGIVNFALTYLITGDANFAQKAISLMWQSMGAGTAQVSNPGHLPTMGPPAYSPPTGIHEVDGDSGYQVRNYMPAASVVYDWCYPVLTPVQRLQLQQDMEVCTDWVWQETNASRAGQWAVDDPLNNYWYGFLLTWMSGITLSGDSPKAQGYLDNAMRRWTTMALPALNGPSAGGPWNEGRNYGTASSGFLLYNLLANQSATGQDLIASTPWLTDMVTSIIQLTNPPMTEIAPFGDLSAGPIADNDRRAMLLMASRDPRAQIWLDQAHPNRCTQRISAWLEFMFATTPVPA